MAKFSVLKLISRWIVTGCRVLVGLLVMKVGIDLMKGGTYVGYNREDTLSVGGFVTIIGLYFVCSSLFHVFFKDRHE
ncbi:MAG: hypothetical protein KKD01_10110 [Proteobacteria bacterium]|nr:hypothetical protein [Pseudomonadota bacterium]MBU1138316.1 hypothetical protein [Pseudomonadota bacterium]MBU1232726.1 hypothetical protein [Pseudomonadota bacterium]MBU1418797.1 hypothetical protein [Pseudomonadota bacterium]MBU1455066.1 hypothetical protein [Pseudomonadota bacterium]